MPNLNEGQFEQPHLFEPPEPQDSSIYYHYSNHPPNPNITDQPFHGGTIDAALDRSYSKVPKKTIQRTPGGYPLERGKGYITAFRAPSLPPAESAEHYEDEVVNSMDKMQTTSYMSPPRAAIEAEEATGGNLHYENKFEDPGSTSVRLRSFQDAQVLDTVPYHHREYEGYEGTPSFAAYGHEGETRYGTSTLHQEVAESVNEIAQSKQGRLFNRRGQPWFENES